MSVITHSELVRELSSTTDFEVVEILLNPGLESTFPWLATQAGSWEFYRFRSLVVHYEPLLSTAHDGLMAMAVEYSVGSSRPPDLKTLMAYQGARSCPVWQKCQMSLDIKSGFPSGGFKYVRHNIEPDDPKLYDCGALMVVVRKPQVSVSAALLRITYTVEFKTPQVEKPLALADGLLSAVRDSETTLLTYEDVNSASGTGFYHMPFFVDQNTLGATVVTLNDGGKAYVLSPGTYQVLAAATLDSDLKSTTPDEFKVSFKIGTGDATGASYTYPVELLKSAYNFYTDGSADLNNFVASGFLYLEQISAIVAAIEFDVTETLVSGSILLGIGSGIILRYLGRGRENARMMSAIAA